jgi:hypothetical protein
MKKHWDDKPDDGAGAEDTRETPNNRLDLYWDITNSSIKIVRK